MNAYVLAAAILTSLFTSSPEGCALLSSALNALIGQDRPAEVTRSVQPEAPPVAAVHTVERPACPRSTTSPAFHRTS